MKNYYCSSILMVLFTLVFMGLATNTAAARAMAEQRACTQMWCVEGYTLQLNAEHWPAGQYAFKIIADDQVFNCEGSLPFNGCGAPAVTCSAEGIMIGESGCALPADTHGFASLQMTEIPDHIAVTIMGPAGSFMYEDKIQKQCSYPNGEHCDPRACCSAMHSVNVSWD